MPSTYTPSLRLTLPSTGDLVGTWGVTVNSGITNLTDQAIAGTASITMTADTTYVLSNLNGQSDEARNMFINVGGGTHTVTTNVVCPAVSKLYYVYNGTTGGQDIVFKTASGSGVTIPNGQRISLYCDGTDVVAAANNTPSVGSITPAMLSTGGPSWNSSGILTAGSGFVASGVRSEQLSTPTGASGTISTTGGTLTPGTYYIKLVAVDNVGNTTAASVQSTFTTSIATSKISLTWTAVPNATAYYVLVGTSNNGQNLYDTVTSNSTAYELTSLAGLSAYSPVGGPTLNTTGGAYFAGDVVSSGTFSMADLFGAGTSYGIGITSTNANYSNVSLTTGSTLGLSLRVYGAGHTTPNHIQFYSETTGPMSFYTNSTERLKIDASGNIVKVGAGDIQLSGTSKVTNSGSGGFESSGSGKVLSSGSGNIETTGSGNISVNGTGVLGYGSSAGGTYTQSGSLKTDPVTSVTTATGKLSTNAGSLSANSSVSFIVSCSKCVATSTVVVNVVGTSNYTAIATAITNGNFTVRLSNVTALTRAESVDIIYAIIQGDS